MQHFLTQPYDETYEPDHEYTFHCKCVDCGSVTDITINARDLYNYHNGMHIQTAFPYVSRDNRELMMTGICGTCFSNMFGMEDDDDDLF